MPDLPALAALVLPALSMPLFIDLAKIFGGPVALFLLARFLSLRDKKREKTEKIKEEAAAEETRLLKVAKETADAERAALRTRMDAMELGITRLGIYHEGVDKVVKRIEDQLSRLIDNFHKLS